MVGCSTSRDSVLHGGRIAATLGRRVVRHRTPQQGSYTLVDEPDLSAELDVSALSGIAVDLHRLFG
jgi:hypothetical protein